RPPESFGGRFRFDHVWFFDNRALDWRDGGEVIRHRFLFALSVVVCVAPCGLRALPRPDHVVVVIMENHSYGRIIGSAEAQNLNALAGERAKFTNWPTDPIVAPIGLTALR